MNSQSKWGVNYQQIIISGVNYLFKRFNYYWLRQKWATYCTWAPRSHDIWQPVTKHCVIRDEGGLVNWVTLRQEQWRGWSVSPHQRHCNATWPARPARMLVINYLCQLCKSTWITSLRIKYQYIAFKMWTSDYNYYGLQDYIVFKGSKLFIILPNSFFLSFKLSFIKKKN